MKPESNRSYEQPDAHGHFGVYGGRFVSETLTHALDELAQSYTRWSEDANF
ncbi:MAG: tryptophan synthase subunit beta, partial [Gammaproteobacteria bacterium]